MAQVSLPPIPLKMYRHFAIVTIALTACLALFADGENREFAEEQANRALQSQVRAERRTVQSNTPAYGEARLERRSGTTTRFGREFDRNYGKPMISPNSRSSVIEQAVVRDDVVIPGYSQAYLDSLSEDELDQLIESLRAAGMLDQNQRRRNMARLEAAARRRSGVSSLASE